MLKLIIIAVLLLCTSCAYYSDREVTAFSFMKNIELGEYKSKVATAKVKTLTPPASVEIGGD